MDVVRMHVEQTGQKNPRQQQQQKNQFRLVASEEISVGDDRFYYTLKNKNKYDRGGGGRGVSAISVDEMAVTPAFVVSTTSKAFVSFLLLPSGRASP